MIVLDAGPMIDYLAGEIGGDVVRDALNNEERAAPVYAHALNLAEVFYHFSRLGDLLTARSALATLEADGVIRREDMDAAFCEDAAQIKADWKRVSLADCVGLALARRLDSEFMTSDRHELLPLQAARVARIVFIR
jgi:predicted nucleic acid-binding protein